MKMLLAAGVMLAALAGGCVAVSTTETTMVAPQATLAMPPITIYHLEEIGRAHV